MSAYKKNPDNLDTKRFAILVRDSQIRLTFTELESLTSFRTSRFLTFNSTRVTSNETFCTKSGFVFRIDLNQCASDSQASCLRLSFEATSIEVDLDIILFCNVQLCERLLNNELKDCRRKVISRSRLLIVIFPVPSLTNTRATAALRLPIAFTTSIVIIYMSLYRLI